MVKKISLLLSVMMLTLAFASCAPASTDTASQETSSSSEVAESSEVTESSESTETEATTADPVDVRAIALKGPTAMGMVKFMDDVENGVITDNNYTFQMAASPDEIAPLIAKGEIDIAAVPANLAAVLYNNTEGGVQVMGINTLGVLYIVENGETITSIEDLKGKTIYASGKGATPEYALRYILTQNGIDPDADVTIEWKTEQAEVVAAIAAEPNAIAMLPQPFVATAQASNESLKVVLDLTEEWNKTQESAEMPSELITGVVIVRKEFAEQNPEAVAAFMANYKQSVDFVNSDVEAGAALVGAYEIVPEAVALVAIPECNIVCIEGEEMKNSLSGYLNVLFEQNPASVGGTLPDDAFYYAVQ